MKIASDLKGQFTHGSIVEKVEEKAKSDQVLKEIDTHFSNGKEPARVADKDDQ
jgi:hypothetical protein